MKNDFLSPPRVKGTLGLDSGGTSEFTPLDYHTLHRMVAILTKGSSLLTPSLGLPTWTDIHIRLLKERYPKQGSLIPELKRPDHESLTGFFTGPFTSQQIIKKANELGLRFGG